MTNPKMKIIAILRGITPNDVLEVGGALLQCGIDVIEVPPNSPDAIQSIRLLSTHYAHTTMIGAGTVLTEAQVAEVANAGARLILSPNMNPEVIQCTRSLGLISVPVVATPTEAFHALEAGANALKLFPAEVLGIASLKAWKSVLPPKTDIFAVGGIEAGNAPSYITTGVAGLGVGGWLYQPGRSLEEIRRLANLLVTVCR